MYEIRIEGLVSDGWSDWFEGLTILHPTENESILRGNLADQAALLGLLAKIHSLNLKITALCQLPAQSPTDEYE